MAGSALGVSSALHSPQNLSSGWLEAPHFGQATTSGAPQLAQNLRPWRLSLLHFEQRIILPDERLSGQLIEQRLRVHEICSSEAFSEPVVDFGEHRKCLVPTALFASNARDS
jgi:hypothetical protein